jgi:hypothetical protein
MLSDYKKIGSFYCSKYIYICVFFLKKKKKIDRRQKLQPISDARISKFMIEK